ncbi:TPA: hypothetical protein DCR49_03865 [Candidatus Delongbacteria bacterium]|nr:MAG: hypothetical protein A2Y39_07610 [Candidatus Delongbacteria bacterium GWF2_40_14]HAQ61124.1 hypothetical protein [Candidatus Delongbacteria bacterium]
MKKLAVAGNPIAYSKSPEIFKVLCAAYDINAGYVRISAESPEEIMSVVSKYGITAFNVTSPFKEKMSCFLHDTDHIAKDTGSVNLVINKNGKFYGFNTDVYGVQHSLLFHNINVIRRKCLVIGAGGAARSAVFALKDLGSEVYICNKTDEKADKISSELGCGLILYENLKENLSDIFLMITAVPEISADIKDELKNIIVFEAGYREPQFKTFCKKHLDGMDWLIYQAVRNFELIFDIKQEFKTVKEELQKRKEKVNLAFIGSTCTGKTAFGKFVAARFGMNFIDTDREIENKAGMKITEMFKVHGEGYFRKRESEVIARSVLDGGSVISIGAGAVESETNRKLIKDNCFTVLIDSDTEVILSRLKMDELNKRPMLDNDRLRESLEKLFGKRKDCYFAAADLIIKTGSGFVEEEAEKIIRELNAR